MGEGLGFLQSVVSSSAGYLRYYSNEEGYELDFCRSQGQAWTHCQYFVSLTSFLLLASYIIDLDSEEEEKELNIPVIKENGIYIFSFFLAKMMGRRTREVKRRQLLQLQNQVLGLKKSKDESESDDSDEGCSWSHGAYAHEKVKLENEQMWLFMDDSIKKPATCNLISRNLPPATRLDSGISEI
ncbi:hypothetical protein ZEAMMB73_Zm00001d010780 [Zea mays]|uniref:Uncharacterized protein n=1 Tax=Zea mays TaxID=4577 RepID=A0A1D6FTL2_MAIZE|nr:hypothetical protein ZEAMMB73_Zm00001d010780 [Zea mays]